MYCLTNLVGMGSRAQLVVFDFMINLRMSSMETTANVALCYFSNISDWYIGWLSVTDG